MVKLDVKATFNIGGLPADRESLLVLARVAEVSERYEDMCEFMSLLVVSAKDATEGLSTEERNLLSVAFKNVVGNRRGSLRSLTTESGAVDDNLTEEYKIQIQKELKKICSDVLELLKAHLIEETKKDKGDEAQVFYLKMAADYHRYLAECLSDDGMFQANSAQENYQKAFDIAERILPATHPIRLGLVLNYSVCLYEILKDEKKACALAKAAFDGAIQKLDQLEEGDYKDSTLIMQLLRDNLTLWTASNDDEDDEN